MYPRMLLQIRLTFGLMYPPRMRLQVRLTFGQTSGQVDIWSDFRSELHVVRCTPRIGLQVKLTFGQTLSLVGIWSDGPPG